MTSIRCQLCLPAILAMAFTLGKPADEPPSRVRIARIGKPATALVEVKSQRGMSYGAAFCVHAEGWFVTNAHVATGEVTLVLNPSLTTQKTYPARVIRSDSDADLALLHIEGVKDLPALALGTDEELEEQMDAMAFGFPLAEGPVQGHRDYPGISVNAGNITRLRRVNGRLKEIQLDAELNPGNSGGPVLDGEGKVIGVVRSGLVAAGLGRTGINQAIPVSAIKQFLARPEVQFNPPALNPANVYKPMLFEAKVVPILPSSRTLTVDLTLKPSQGDEQVLHMKAGGTSHSASAVPVPPPPGPMRLRLLAVFGDGMVNAITTTDATFKIGERDVKLSDVRTLKLGPDSSVKLGGGEVLEGVVSGLDAVRVELGGQPFSLDLTKATEVKVAPDVSSDLVWCTLTVRDGDRQVWTQTDSLIVEGLLPVPNQTAGPTGIKPPALEANQVVRMLPSVASDVVVGGAGRYLVLKLSGAKRLAVFDVNEAQIVGGIPVQDENVHFAAGLEHLMVLQSASETMERYSLKTLKREASVPLPIKGVIKSVAMGSASRGPLLVHWAVGIQELDRAAFTLIDPIQMRVQEADAKISHLGGVFREMIHLRASANGTVFGMWCTSHTPSGVGVLVASIPAAQWYYAHQSLGHIVPAPDGTLLFTNSGMCSPQVSLTQNPEPKGGSVLPAEHGALYLKLGSAEAKRPGAPPRNDAPNDRPAADAGDVLTICAPGRDKPVARVIGAGTLPEREEWLKHDFTFDKRVHLIPDARLVITIPISNDRLVLSRYGAE